MNRKLLILALGLLVVSGFSSPVHAVTPYEMFSSGYYDGPTVAGTVGFMDIFTNVPLAFEAELGYSWSNLGDPYLASQVFIDQQHLDNPATSSGGTLHLAFNATYPIPMQIGKLKMFAVGGPRWARWDARHQYHQDNEDFDVVGKVWGLGGGLRGVLPLSPKMQGVIQLTVDYYPRASIYGHDTTYNPDNDNINAENNPAGGKYAYEDAARATAVPHIRPRVMVGIMF